MGAPGPGGEERARVVEAEDAHLRVNGRGGAEALDLLFAAHAGARC